MFQNTIRKQVGPALVAYLFSDEVTDAGLLALSGLKDSIRCLLLADEFPLYAVCV